MFNNQVSPSGSSNQESNNSGGGTIALIFSSFCLFTVMIVVILDQKKEDEKNKPDTPDNSTNVNTTSSYTELNASFENDDEHDLTANLYKGVLMLSGLMLIMGLARLAQKSLASDTSKLIQFSSEHHIRDIEKNTPCDSSDTDKSLVTNQKSEHFSMS